MTCWCRLNCSPVHTRNHSSPTDPTVRARVCVCVVHRWTMFGARSPFVWTSVHTLFVVGVGVGWMVLLWSRQCKYLSYLNHTNLHLIFSLSLSLFCCCFGDWICGFVIVWCDFVVFCLFNDLIYWIELSVLSDFCRSGQFVYHISTRVYLLEVERDKADFSGSQCRSCHFYSLCLWLASRPVLRRQSQWRDSHCFYCISCDIHTRFHGIILSWLCSLHLDTALFVDNCSFCLNFCLLLVLQWFLYFF